jgi:hypothetical protein
MPAILMAKCRLIKNSTFKTRFPKPEKAGLFLTNFLIYYLPGSIFETTPYHLQKSNIEIIPGYSNVKNDS